MLPLLLLPLLLLLLLLVLLVFLLLATRVELEEMAILCPLSVTVLPSRTPLDLGLTPEVSAALLASALAAVALPPGVEQRRLGLTVVD